jgi:DNA polymerase III sliding clamp (beta) subunit (PCNA family)
VPWKPLDALQAVLVPPWAVERFSRGADGTVTLGWDDRVVTLQCENLQVTSRVTGGEWPSNWRSMLPDVPCPVEVDTEDLLGALKRAQLASEADSSVELSFTTGQLHIAAGYGNHSDDVLDASYDGPEFRVLFGIGYLTDGLAGCGAVTSFGFTDPLRKVFVTSGSYSYTLLPRRRL